MKCRLLKRLRRRGRNQITIHSVSKSDGFVTGMSYGFDEDEYGSLFDIGDTAEEVKNKAARIYIEKYLENKKDEIRSRKTTKS
jgi:hypothetical protein